MADHRPSFDWRRTPASSNTCDGGIRRGDGGTRGRVRLGRHRAAHPPKNPWPTKTHHQLSSAWGDCAPAQTRRPRTSTLSCLHKRGEGWRPHRGQIPTHTDRTVCVGWWQSACPVLLKRVCCCTFEKASCFFWHPCLGRSVAVPRRGAPATALPAHHLVASCPTMGPRGWRTGTAWATP